MRKNIAASFYLQPRGTTEKSDIQFNLNNMFRPGRRGGYVEKNKFRLDQAKEIIQIQSAKRSKVIKWW